MKKVLRAKNHLESGGAFQGLLRKLSNLLVSYLLVILWSEFLFLVPEATFGHGAR